MCAYISDISLIRSYLRGDADSFKILLNRYQSKVYGFILSKVKDYDVAQDIFQDVFIKVIDNLQRGKYKEEGKFFPWVMRITYNQIMDHFRAKQKRVMIRESEDFSIFECISEAESSKEELLIFEQIKEEAKELITLLPEKQKIVLEKRIFCKMSFQEIAEEENVSINTALGRMRYAVLNLRKYAKEREIDLNV
jgi:RNA polymerase sigma-70 factor (ECF subfamily)